MRWFKELLFKTFLIAFLAVITIGLDFLAARVSKETMNYILSFISRDSYGYIMNLIFENYSVIFWILIVLFFHCLFLLSKIKKCGNRSYRTEKRKLRLLSHKLIGIGIKTILTV